MSGHGGSVSAGLPEDKMPTPELPARTSSWQWLQVVLLVVNLWWTTLCLGGYRPETMVVTSALTGLLLIVHFGGRAWARGPEGRQCPHPAGWWLLPFLIYAAANAAWITPVPWLGWHDWLTWAQMIAVFWVVLNSVRSPVAWTMVFGALFTMGAVAAGLACYQHFVKPDWMMLGRIQTGQFIGRASGPFGIPNSLGAFLLLLIPSAGFLACQRGAGTGRRILFAGLTLFFAVGLVLTISRGAWLGLALALAVWPLFRRGRHWGWRIGGAALVLALLFAVGVALYSSIPEVRQRLLILVRDVGERSRPIIWRGAWHIFRDHPLWGGGAGGFDPLFEKYRPEYFQDQPQWAHNDYLNTLCDYGLVGFLLFFAAGAGIVWRSWRGSRQVEVTAATGSGVNAVGFRQALAIGLIAFSLQLFVEFHFKIPALAMSFATIAALWMQRGWTRSSSAGVAEKPARLLNWVAAGAVAAITILFVLPHYRAEASRYGVRQQIDKLAVTPIAPEDEQTLFLHGRDFLARATRIDPSNAQAWSDLAYATELWSIQQQSRGVELGRRGRAIRQAGLGTFQNTAGVLVTARSRAGYAGALGGRRGCPSWLRCVWRRPIQPLVL